MAMILGYENTLYLMTWKSCDQKLLFLRISFSTTF